LTIDGILELVNAGVVDMTVADDIIARLWAKVLPNLVVREDLPLKTGVTAGWAVRKGNPELQKSLNGYFKKARKGTSLGNVLFKRYFGNTRWIKNPLADPERRKLGKFVSLFKKYGGRYGFDYLAIAAQAYQESGLNHNMRGPGGAVGIMQLLPSTAADPNVGIRNIYKAENNIHAGIKYLAFLRDTYFEDPQLSEADRLAFVWAAYNAGPAKVARMRKRATRMGLDPNQWFENVEYAALKVVGRGTVRYVANVYKYYVAYSLMRDLIDQQKAVVESKKQSQDSL
jgi:membrane-bound lytic murein transglycosylase MltF